MPVSINGNTGVITGLAVGGLPDGTIDADSLASNAVTSAKLASGVGGKVLKVTHVMDGSRASTSTEIQNNSFTSGLILSNLTTTITPTDATTVFLITGSLQLDHIGSFTGKLWITYQISGGSEQMIAGNSDTPRRCTALFSAGQDGANPGLGCQPVSFSLYLDHNTTSAITFRARIATTSNAHGLACYNRDVGNTQNGGDGGGVISSLCFTELVGSSVTASENTIYRGT